MKYNRYNDNNYRGAKFLYAIYPDWWPKRWGKPPVLGEVVADSEFDAVRAAYDSGILSVNRTFEPRPVLIGEHRGSSKKQNTG